MAEKYLSVSTEEACAEQVSGPSDSTLGDLSAGRELPWSLAGARGAGRRKSHGTARAGSTAADELHDVLVVDDQEMLLKAVRRMFASRGVMTSTALTVADAITIVEQGHAQVAIVDVMIPGTSGIELMKTLQARYPDIVVIAISGKFTVEVEEECMAAGVAACLPKPFDKAGLFAAIEELGVRLPESEPDLTLDTATASHIDYVLKLYGGSKSAAAQVLKVPRPSLQRMLKEKPSSDDER